MLELDPGIFETSSIMLLHMGVEGGSSGNRQLGQIELLIQVQYEVPVYLSIYFSSEYT